MKSELSLDAKYQRQTTPTTHTVCAKIDDFCNLFVRDFFRCVTEVQEFRLLLTGLGVECEVSLEPGLFEWLGWYLAGVPRFMTPQEFHDAGLPICLTYSPIWPLSRYNIQETTEQFYDRCYQVTREILKKHESEGLCFLRLCCRADTH